MTEFNGNNDEISRDVQEEQNFNSVDEINLRKDETDLKVGDELSLKNKSEDNLLDQQLNKTINPSDQELKKIQALQSASSSASGSSAASAAASVAPTAVAVVTVVAVGAVVVSAPNVDTNDWLITHQEIQFDFVGETVETPYLIEITDQETTELISSIELYTSTDNVSFENLVSEHAYEIVISADYGGGMIGLKSYKITTAGAPLFPKGVLKVNSTNIDYGSNQLSITLTYEDEGHYYSDVEIVVTDGINVVRVSQVDVNQVTSIDISSLQRTYLNVDVYAKSSYPSDENAVIKTASYKVYY